MKRFVSARRITRALCLATACSLAAATSARAAKFGLGADVGWLSEMESGGIKFYGLDGAERDCLRVLQDYGIDSIRLRVWVNPVGGWCGQDDVVTMAVRAKNLGLRVMIDFHYSDWWADPGKQNKPAAWANHGIDELRADVAAHTTAVLSALKNAGVTPEWVQVGNETNNGLLWPDGMASTNMPNYARLVASGYDAVKSVFPDTKVIVHVSNGWDTGLFQWNIGGLVANGAKFDVIAMSLYPSASDWSMRNEQCLVTMNDMLSRYGKEIMISEVGMDVIEPDACKAFLADLIAKTKSLPNGKGLGVFYWEPEAHNRWRGYSLGAFGSDGRPTLAMTAFADAAPAIITQPRSISAAAGATVSLVAAGKSAPTYRWRKNGASLTEATSHLLSLPNFAPANTGLYDVVVTASSPATSDLAIVGVTTTDKTIGHGEEVGPDIRHPNGNTFDQVLLGGAAATIIADPTEITRISFIDLTNDIVQVEFSGAGSLSIVLDAFTGSAPPLNYHQPTINYAKGHPGIVVTGANETSHLSVFTVGRATAFDLTGRYDILQPPSSTNDPANNGSALFQGHNATVYDGFADLAFIAIASANGKFGGLRTSNATYYASRGPTGIYAPGVEFQGPVFAHDIGASDTATPLFIIGSSPDTRVTGGDLQQSNGAAVSVRGLTQLKFTAGSDSHGRLFSAQDNRATLVQDGADVTAQIVVNP